MSSTFDTMQHAVAWLSHHDGSDPDRAYWLGYYLRVAIDRLHDLHHEGIRELNSVAYPAISCLDIVLTEDDPDKRAARLDRRMDRQLHRDQEDGLLADTTYPGPLGSYE